MKTIFAFFLLISVSFASFEKPEGANRDLKKYPILNACVSVNDASGCICYYDANENSAYVISCAHIFKGKKETYPVRIFYKDDKLDIHSYQAKLLVIDVPNDLTLLKFSPDFTPTFVPIAGIESSFMYPEKAPLNERVLVGGRDAHSNPAIYEAFIIKPYKTSTASGKDLLQGKQAMSQGGRSGGPLFTKDGKYIIGVTWGHHRPNGEKPTDIAYGWWHCLSKVQRFLKVNKYSWLINPSKLNQIPKTRAVHIPN